MATGAAALFFVTGALLALVHFSENRPVAELVRFQIPAPGNSDAYPIVFPNGRLISFEARDSAGRNMLWVRSLDSLDTRPLPGTENSAGFPGFPVWSPDSRFLAFEQQGKLKKVEVSGGAPQALCDYQGPLRGGAWSRQGVIVFGSGGHGLMQVSDSGGAASPVTAIDTSRQEIFHGINGNSFLPDGRHFVYYRGSRAVENRAVYVGRWTRNRSNSHPFPWRLQEPRAFMCLRQTRRVATFCSGVKARCWPSLSIIAGCNWPERPCCSPGI
jgi:dipeptidyl aminopeptidase/acylaminoacyl peptidase